MHREILQLWLLIAVAVLGFFLTRAVAASNRSMSLRDAAEWYSRGQQQLAAGRVDQAIDSFRRATVRDRENRRYVLALAGALSASGEGDAARSELMALRESTPEDPEINLQIARLAAARQDVTEALRYYHNALYAAWPSDKMEARRQVRLELIRFLITHNQASRALSELLALAADLPDAVAIHIEVARLFAEAGDNRHALEHFERALRLAPDEGDALAGAGKAAYQLGDYTVARTYLRRAPPGAGGVENTRAVVELVLSNDPLASRIGSAERRRRLTVDLSYAQERLTACAGQGDAVRSTEAGLALQREAQAFQAQVKPSTTLGQDRLEAGLELIDRVERQITPRCAGATPLDQALVLIARQHGAEER